MFFQGIRPDPAIGGDIAGFGGVDAFEPCFVLAPEEVATASDIEAPSRVSPWTTADTGVRAPARTLVAVRAMAPVTGMPPTIGTTMLAAPCATSSAFELWWLPVM